MALTSPLLPSPSAAGLRSSFSPWTGSPNSPLPGGISFQAQNGTSEHSDSLAPPSPYPQHVDPSPTDSNGTDNTDIDDSAQDEASDTVEDTAATIDTDARSPKSPENLARIDTSVQDRLDPGSDDAPQSVIHVPQGFKQFDTSNNNSPSGLQTSISPASKTVHTVVSPSTPDAARGPDDKRLSGESPQAEKSPGTTPATDDSTPKPDARPVSAESPSVVIDVNNDLSQADDTTVTDKVELEKRKQSTSNDSALEPAAQAFNQARKEVQDLRTALSECWTLCNTLSTMSSSHRQRMFSTSSSVSEQKHAWRSCWRLCQQLYDSHEEPSTQVQPTLDLCRDFCSALFDARQRVDAIADSVLRVSFELNNHLYHMQDHQLPQAFQQRTLDFYVALCHRMMKQRTSLPQETDALLRACWSLAEMFFNLRQSNRQQQVSELELLGSAVQACWDLCDLFREGWSQVRPDRGTPKPSQTTFAWQADKLVPPSEGRSSSLSNNSYHDAASFPAPFPPETPITVFDDVTASSSPDSVTVPNILVLGPLGGPTNTSGQGMVNYYERWSSNASTLSGQSKDAGSTAGPPSSTAASKSWHVVRLHALILKAALIAGYRQQHASSASSSMSGSSANTSPKPSLQDFARLLPQNAFGNLPWQMHVLESYKRLVQADPSLRNLGKIMSRRFSTIEVAKAVRWLSDEDGGEWMWMRDLYRLVNGFVVEDVERRGGIMIT